MIIVTKSITVIMITTISKSFWKCSKSTDIHSSVIIISNIINDNYININILYQK